MEMAKERAGLAMYWPLLISLVSTFYFMGLIWVIQVLHYPLFARVGSSEFQAYHNEHNQRITMLLGLPVLVAFAGAVLLVSVKIPGVPAWSSWLNLVFTFSFWLVTAAVQIPLHEILSGGFSAQTIQALVDGNWIRTFIWTFQGGLLLWMTAVAMQAILQPISSSQLPSAETPQSSRI